MEDKVLKRRTKKVFFNRRGQGALEVAIVLILVVLLVGGITKIFFWATTSIVDRQISYNQGRLFAGRSMDGYVLQWPLSYKPPALTDGDVMLYRGK
jgi:hypothetical protein